MAQIVDILLTDLLLDGLNPRLETSPAGQQQTMLRLAEQQGERIIKLAEDIVKFGVDPTSLPGVVAVGDPHKRYKVMEGNRRTLVLKALETPSLINPVLAPKDAKKLAKLSSEFAKSPIDEIQCVLFKDEAEADHWIELRHTGANNGSGLVEWGSEEKDRYAARHAGVRKPAGQVIDFVNKHGSLSAAASTSKMKILTNLERLLSSPEARETLGIDIDRGQVVALYPTSEVAKSLSRVVEDLKTGVIAVPELYNAEKRREYAASLPRSARPTKKARLAGPVSLAGLTAGQTTPAPKPKSKKRTAKKPERTTVITKDASLNVSPPRISAIHNELLTLVTASYPNACSVLLRVFVELSVDQYITDKKLTPGSNDPLAKRLKLVAGDLKSRGKIPEKLRKAVEQVANGPSPIAPGLSTFNQYVHNQYTYPKPADLFAAWDELQPLMEAIWP